MKLGFDVRYNFESFLVDQEEIVENSSNNRFIVNPLLIPWVAYLFQTRWEGGGGALNRDGRVLEREGLYNLVKMVVSALHKELECKVESSIQAAEDQNQIRPSNTRINHPGSVQMKFYSRD